MLPGRLPWGVYLGRLAQRGLSSAANGSASSMQTACLQEVRGVIRLSGPGLVHFLQGIVTNDVLPLEAPGAPPMYTCILNAQGRYLHDLILHRTLDEVPTVFVDTDRQGKEDLLRLLKRYRLRQKIAIDDVSEDYHVWARFGSGASAAEAALAAEEAAGARQEPRQAGLPGWAADPRLQQLGLRAVLPAGEVEAGGGSGGSSSWWEHRRWRMQLGVAEGDSEIPTGEVIPLEFNIDGLSGISFTKGCYVGQELMARTHFKGVVRKRLMPFTLNTTPTPTEQQQQQRQQEGPSQGSPADGGSGGGGEDRQAAAAGVQPGAAVYIEQPGGGKQKPIGTVRVVDGSLGLAVLRLSAVEAAQAAGQALVVGEGEGRAEVRPWRPDWWPESWGREDGQAGAGADG